MVLGRKHGRFRFRFQAQVLGSVLEFYVFFYNMVGFSGAYLAIRCQCIAAGGHVTVEMRNWSNTLVVLCRHPFIRLCSSNFPWYSMSLGCATCFWRHGALSPLFLHLQSQYGVFYMPREMFNLAPRVIINISNVTAAQLSSLTRPVRYPKDKQTIAPTTGASEPRTCVLRPHQHVLTQDIKEILLMNHGIDKSFMFLFDAPKPTITMTKKVSHEARCVKWRRKKSKDTK